MQLQEAIKQFKDTDKIKIIYYERPIFLYDGCFSTVLFEGYAEEYKSRKSPIAPHYIVTKIYYNEPLDKWIIRTEWTKEVD